MTITRTLKAETCFLLTGLAASFALHGTLFLSRPPSATYRPFAVQPSDFSIEITRSEPAPSPEAAQPAVLTHSDIGPEAAPSSSPTLSPPQSTPSPALSAPTAPANVSPQPPAPASSTILARPDASHQVPPLYPEWARKRGWEGSVLLQAEVARDGTVESVCIVESSGHEVLDLAAIKAVRQWRFHPSMIGGEATRSQVEVPVKFSLKRSSRI